MKKISMGFLLSVTLVLSGCNSDSSIENQLSVTLTKMNNAEHVYQDALAELTELEKSEQEIFNQTMELTQKQFDELEIKVTELEELLVKRLTLIEGEVKSVRKASKFVDELDAIIEQVDGNVGKDIEELKKAVTKRYELHSAFVVEYKKLTSLQKELYGILIAEGVELEGLKDKVGEVNEQNEVVQFAVISFNDATVKVNVLKDDTISGLQQEK
ncbi:YkyA family protein [Sporosarcina sp. E16_8]|uniref:YkyA family protein n=1 Tax=Sporosarcina sp. E16_8 TaxID=2789295 RepID=UPI001A935B74|nr:YkyA family protein [Sporosarcina sp. E16_8]MBO0585926.1 YkyA family protein [Sporosarcina sp. E16_8]